MVIEGSIPVLGTAIVNAPHWLYRLYDSIDYPVDHFVVFNNNGRDQITEEIDSLKEERHPFIKKLHICHLPGNLGCAGAWNMIIKSFLNLVSTRLEHSHLVILWQRWLLASYLLETRKGGRRSQCTSCQPENIRIRS